jgi:hypothetical protein
LAERCRAFVSDECGLENEQTRTERLQNDLRKYLDGVAARGEKPLLWVIVDESSMSSYKALDAISAMVERTGGTMAGIGDGAQLPSIEGGAPHDALSAVAQEHDTYAELREVWRQKGGPLAFLAANPTATTEEERLGLVARTGEAIRAGDERGVERFVHELDAHGLLEACDARDDVVMAAAEWYVRDPAGALLGCKDRETVKHTNGQIRAGLGLAGTGHDFRLGRSGRETREIAVGDRVQFPAQFQARRDPGRPRRQQ